MLDQLDIQPGARALDLGCGPQGVLELLCERVGPSGSVIGVEKSAEFADQARKHCAERRLDDVRIVGGDARATLLPRASFDVIFTRLLLVNVTAPEEIAAEMVALLRPGGVLASYEPDFRSHLCDPPSPAWDRLLELFLEYSRKNGTDPFIGRRTHRLLREAGLADVQVSPVVHSYPLGYNRRMILLNFIYNIRTQAVQQGLIDAAELTRLIESLQHHLEDPETMVLSQLYFRVWGRKP